MKNTGLFLCMCCSLFVDVTSGFGQEGIIIGYIVDDIKIGTTKKKVIEIYGKPFSDNVTVAAWIVQDGVLNVFFDKDGLVLNQAKMFGLFA